MSRGTFEMACGTQMRRVTNSQDDQTHAALPRRGDNPLRRLAEFHHDFRRPIKFPLFPHRIVKPLVNVCRKASRTEGDLLGFLNPSL